MATIDKQSVRAEFDKIKVGFDEQVKSGKVSTEVAMLVNTLMLLFNLVLSIFMEKSTKKTSANSSIPPSQTSPDDTSITTKSKTGEDQNKQKTVTVAGNTRTVKTVTLLPALTWPNLTVGVTATHFTKRLRATLPFFPANQSAYNRNHTSIGLIFSFVYRAHKVPIRNLLHDNRSK